MHLSDNMKNGLDSGVTSSLFDYVKRLGTNTFIYALGDFLVKGFMLLLIPLYTSFLLTSDYGILGVTDMVSGMMGIILTLQLTGAITIYYFRLDATERKLLLSTIWLFFLIIPTSITFVLIILGNKSFNTIFPDIPFSPYIQLALVGGYLTIFSLIPQTLFRLREQPVPLVLFNLFGFGINIGLSIYFVVVLHMGARGVLWAFFISNAIMAVIYIIVTLKDVSLIFSWPLLTKSIILCIPLLPHMLSYWALSLSDRAILQAYVPLSDLGIYRLAFQFGTAFQLFVTAANNAWIPIFFNKAVDKKSWEKLSRLATYLVLALIMIGTGIAIFAGEIIRLVTPVSYHSAAKIVPFFILGSLINIFYLIWANATVFSKHTSWMTIGSVIAATINIIANLLTIPTFGIAAAAVNAVGGSVVLALVHFFVSRRLLPLPHEYGRWAKVCLTALTLYIFGGLLPKSVIWINLVGRAAIWCSWPVILIVLGFWNKNEYNFARKFLTHLIAKWGL